MWTFRKKYAQVLLYCLSLWGLFVSISSYEQKVSWEDFIWENRSVILLDISRSMNIGDMPQGKDRLSYAKKYINQYILKSSDLIWVSVFAWNWVNISPISGQKLEIIDLIAGLDYKHIREQWSRIDIGIERALELFWDELWWKLIIFTDQDSLEWNQFKNRIKNIADTTQKLGLQIYIVWIGTEKWWPIPIGVDMMWNIQYKRYNAELVLAPLERDYLKSIASILWWKYVDIKDFENTIWDNIIQYNISYWNKLSYIFLFISCVFFFINIYITFSKFWKKIFPL